MATLLQPPAPQTPGERPISFLLDDAVSGIGQVEALTLYVRPEDLTRQDPSRVNITQTLGGAWGDSFGPGIPMITIAGHTGWRRDQANDDGETRFQLLRDQVFNEWHARRAAAVSAGLDPSNVQLIFSDALDSFSAVVAPLSFVLRRSRSRPLLLQYQIQMAVLGEAGDFLGAAQLPMLGLTGGGNDILRTLGLDSLANSVDRLSGYANSIKNFVDGNMVKPMRGFLAITEAVYRRVMTAVASVDGAAASLLNVAQLTARSGANIFHTLAAVVNLPSRIRGQLMRIAATYTNIFCVLKNALKARELYDDYGPVYGASNCSSTSGGRPISAIGNANTFALAVPAPVPPIVSVSPQALSSLNALSQSDVVLAPMPTADVGVMAGVIANGVVLA